MSRSWTDCNVIVFMLSGKITRISEVLMKLSASRYCTMNYLMSLEDQTCWVIFIVKVSRISSQSPYIGFQGGEYYMDYDHYCNAIICWLNYTWSMTRLKPCFVFCIKGIWHSVHIDDLRDSEDMSLNLLGFCGTLISNLLNPALSGRNCTSSGH